MNALLWFELSDFEKPDTSLFTFPISVFEGIAASLEEIVIFAAGADYLIFENTDSVLSYKEMEEITKHLRFEIATSHRDNPAEPLTINLNSLVGEALETMDSFPYGILKKRPDDDISKGDD